LTNPFTPSWAATPAQPAAAPVANAAAVARAEAALKSRAGQFAVWMQDEIAKLDAARAAVAAEGLAGPAGETLYLHAHDLKGLGGTYQFPIVSRIAGALCGLLEDPQHRAGAPLALIDAHLEAIKAMVREDIRDELHPMGGSIAAALENKVRAVFGRD
jgi:hypothetical protein